MYANFSIGPALLVMLLGLLALPTTALVLTVLYIKFIEPRLYRIKPGSAEITRYANDPHNHIPI